MESITGMQEVPFQTVSASHWSNPKLMTHFPISVSLSSRNNSDVRHGPEKKDLNFFLLFLLMFIEFVHYFPTLKGSWQFRYWSEYNWPFLPHFMIDIVSSKLEPVITDGMTIPKL